MLEMDSNHFQKDIGQQKDMSDWFEQLVATIACAVVQSRKMEEKKENKKRGGSAKRLFPILYY